MTLKNIVVIIYTSLLCLVPSGSAGQTLLSDDNHNTPSISAAMLAKGQPASALTIAEPELRKYRSKGWGKLLWKGGIIRTKDADGRRTGPYYIEMESLMSSLLRIDFVNGYTVGPDLILGYVNRDMSRWQLHANVEYGCSRGAWMGEGALRYIAPPQYDSWVEVFGGRRTTDFDPEPLMGRLQQDAAVALFGWNGFKLYEAERYGLRGRYWAGGNLRIEAGAWLEGRYEMSNHRKTNSFGKHPDSNVPVCYDMPVSFFEVDHPIDPLLNWEQNPFLHWVEDHLWRADLTLEYIPQSLLEVEDDMHSQVKSNKPTMRLTFKAAWDGGDRQWGGRVACYDAYDDPEDRFRYLSFDFSIEQQLVRRKHHIAYYGSVGGFPVSRNVGLADYRHFDAAHYCWQDRMKNSLKWFSLLTNYEASTGNVWNEIHAEHRYQHNAIFGQYTQVHLLHAPERQHLEFSYGWHLIDQMRIGLSVGFDNIYNGFDFDGIGFNMIIEARK